MNAQHRSPLPQVASYWLPKQMPTDPEQFRRTRRISFVGPTFLLVTIVFAVVYTFLGSPTCAAIVLSTALSILAALVLLKRGGRPDTSGNLITLGGFVTITFVAALNGGLSGPSLLWYTVLPVVAGITAGVLPAVCWCAICVAGLCGLGLAQYGGVSFTQDLSPKSMTVLYFAALVGLIMCQCAMYAVRASIEERAIDAFRKAKQELTRLRSKLATLDAQRGYSVAEVERLEREHAALCRFVMMKYRSLDCLDEETDDDDIENCDLALDDIDDDDDFEDDEHGLEQEADPDLGSLALSAILGRKV